MEKNKSVKIINQSRDKVEFYNNKISIMQGYDEVSISIDDLKTIVAQAKELGYLND